MIVFPLVEILLYLALLFAPADATRISISGPAPEDNVELRLTVTGWVRTHNGAEQGLSLSGSRLLTRFNKQVEATDVAAHIGSVKKDHDWSHTPKLTLSGFTTLEKTNDSYVFRVNDDGGKATRSYVITYHRPPPVDPASAISVKVLGQINNPGAYQLAKGATLLDAIVAAGGFTRLSTRSNTRIVRGQAGEKTQTLVVDVNKIINESLAAPVLENNDTIFVPETIL